MSQTPTSSQPDTTPIPSPALGSLRTSTRTTTKSLNPAAREEARVDAVKEIATVNDAVAKLVSREYSVPDQEYSITHLATILFQLTATLPAEGASIVKSVAMLLKELDLDNHAEHMAEALMTTLRDPLQEFIETSAAVQSHADRVIDGHDAIENCVLEIVSRVDKLQDAFRNTQEKAEANYNAVQNMIATLDQHFPSPDNQNPPPSATQCLKSNLLHLTYPGSNPQATQQNHDQKRRMTEADHVHQGPQHAFARP